MYSGRKQCYDEHLGIICVTNAGLIAAAMNSGPTTSCLFAEQQLHIPFCCGPYQ